MHLEYGFIVWTKEIIFQDSFLDYSLINFQNYSERNQNQKNSPINFVALTGEDYLKTFNISLVKLEIQKLDFSDNEENSLSEKRFSEQFLNFTVISDNFLVLLDKTGNF